MQCLLNGSLVGESDAVVSAFDRGFLYADGLFETLRCYGGRPFLLAEHWARLAASAAFLGIPMPPADPAELVARVLDANGLADASVRVTLTRGPLPAGPRPGPLGNTRLLEEDRGAEGGAGGAPRGNRLTSNVASRGVEPTPPSSRPQPEREATRGEESTPPSSRAHAERKASEETPTLLVQSRPLRPEVARNAAEGVAAARLPWPLRARGLPLQGHKTLAYLPSVLALSSVAEGVEPLLETTDGHLSEGATSNLFWVEGGWLLTPHLDAGCLPGITRALVLRLAAELHLSVEEGLFHAERLARSSEAFLTNSVIEVVPLVRLEGAPVGNGSPGPLTRALQAAYRRRVAAETGR